MELNWGVIENSKWDSAAAVGRKCHCWGDTGHKRKSLSGAPCWQSLTGSSWASCLGVRRVPAQNHRGVLVIASHPALA